MSENGRVRASEAAAIIAGWPRLLAVLLVEHVAGPDGRCRGCVVGVRGAPRWPCGIADLAASAQALNAAIRP